MLQTQQLWLCVYFNDEGQKIVCKNEDFFIATLWAVISSLLVVNGWFTRDQVTASHCSVQALFFSILTVAFCSFYSLLLFYANNNWLPILQPKWKQVFSAPQNSFQYSSQSKQDCCLDNLKQSLDLQFYLVSFPLSLGWF